MKKNQFFASTIQLVCLLATTILFNACSSSSEDTTNNGILPAPEKNPAQNSYALVIQAMAAGQDVTTKGAVKSASLFIFDESNQFIQQINLEKSTLLQRKAISIDCPNTDKITVIAWGGLTESEQVCPLQSAQLISDLTVQLKQNGGVAAAPGDLFYGQITLNRPATKNADAQVLQVERKVSSLAIQIKGVDKKYGTAEGSYYFLVKKTKSAFNHQGDLAGQEIEYVIPAFFNNDNELVAETTPILPTSEVEIELYRDSELVFSSKNTKNSKTIAAKAGEQVNLFFNLSLNNCYIKVTPWGTIIQDVTVG